MEGAKRSPVRAYLDRIFIDRELFLRANDKVRYLRLSRPMQQGLLAAGAFGFCWMLYATGSMIWQGFVLGDKNDEIARQKLDYFNLLAEVSDYHKQFERIARDLQGNQRYLLTLLERSGDPAGETEDAKGGLAQSELERDRLIVARDGLRRKLQAFDGELTEIGERNLMLRAKVADMRTVLNTSPDEHQRILTARERLGKRFRDTELALAEAIGDRDRYAAELASAVEALANSGAAREAIESERVRLQDQIAALTAEIGQARNERTSLNHTIANLELALDREIGYGDSLETERDAFEASAARLEADLASVKTEKRELATRIAALEASLDTAKTRGKALEAEKELLNSRVAGLERALSDADNTSSTLETEVAGLEERLAGEQGRGEKLRKERDFYELRVGSLEMKLDTVRDAQRTVVDRLLERTMQSTGEMERTVAMTGMDVDSVLSTVTVANLGLNQGGPFVPGDFISETDPSYELQASVAVLDLHLDRWEALHRVVKMLPLTAPLDHYRVSSKFGIRKDPINGRKATHYGLDMAAPMRSVVSATAPGKVVFAGWRGRYGRMIEVDHGLGIRTRYGHLKKILVKPGQEVGHREKIGLLGSSGRSTGPHVHYEVLVNGKPVDPGKFLEAGRHVFKG